MKTTWTIATLVVAMVAVSANADDKAAAGGTTMERQEMMAAFERMGAVRAEHRQLEYFVGDWTTKNTMWMDPKAPPQTSEGTSHCEAVFGGRYFETKAEGNMMGQPFSGRGINGYDNLGGTYFATWYDSMSTGFFMSAGTYDKASNSYTYHGSRDDPMAPTTKVPIRAVVRIVDATHYSFDWYEKRGGKEAKTMQIDYTKR
jgi:hypothetical protein